jgi:hypothetical protein
MEVANPDITRTSGAVLKSCRMKTDVEQEPSDGNNCAGKDEPPSAASMSSNKSKHTGNYSEHRV